MPHHSFTNTVMPKLKPFTLQVIGCTTKKKKKKLLETGCKTVRHFKAKSFKFLSGYLSPVLAGSSSHGGDVTV